MADEADNNPAEKGSGPRRRLAGLNPGALLAQAMQEDEPSTVLQERTHLAGCELGSQLGQGGMGAVYLARQINLDREVAVKVIPDELLAEPQLLERFEREARTMASLRHPHIVTVHDFRKLEQGGAAIIMEYVPGGSLRDLLRQHPRGLPVEMALRIVRQMAAGLEAAHAAGIVHRDMKPENVLLDEQGSARLTDFGIAHPVNPTSSHRHRLTLTGAAVGTLEYMAPEQMRGEDPDPRMDIFALGMILYEMLVGQAPRGSFEPPHKVRPQIPAALSTVIIRALRPDRAARFQSATAFRLALSDAREFAPRRRIVPLAMIAAALAVGVFAWMRPRSSGKIDPSTTPSPAASPARSLATPAPGPWRDALSRARLPAHVISGGWQIEGGNLVSDAGICILSLATEMPEFYDARVRFTRLSGSDSVVLFFSANASVGGCELDAWREGLGGVQLIGGQSLMDGIGFQFALENGRAYDLLVEVRPNLVRVSVDGTLIQSFDLTGKYLFPATPWEWNSMERPAALAIGSWQSPTRFEKVEWRSMDYAIKRTREARDGQ